MPRIERQTILARLHDMVRRRVPIVGGGAGVGLSAKCEEAGGIDLIVIYNSGRYRMAGRGSAAGLLAIPLSRQPRDYIVLFRAERLRNVRWAGNPEKPVEYGPHGSRLTPRKSFEQWSELVKGRALPFSEAELRVARAVRTALLEVVLRFSEDVGLERRRRPPIIRDPSSRRETLT